MVKSIQAHIRKPLLTGGVRDPGSTGSANLYLLQVRSIQREGGEQGGEMDEDPQRQAAGAGGDGRLPPAAGQPLLRTDTVS